MEIKELKPCPFCGMAVEVARTDGEGNFRPDEYFDGPWSGVAYHITHPYSDDNASSNCPVATHVDEFVGCVDYYDIQELIAAWNKRNNDEVTGIAVSVYTDDCKKSNTECRHRGWKCGVCDKILNFAKAISDKIEQGK